MSLDPSPPQAHLLSFFIHILPLLLFFLEASYFFPFFEAAVDGEPGVDGVLVSTRTGSS